MDFIFSVAVVALVLFILHKCCGRKKRLYPDISQYMKTEKEPNSLLKLYGVRHVNAIVDQFASLEEVTGAVRRAGLESSNLIFGIDYTASNLQMGVCSFAGRSLHTIDPRFPNPYQQVIRILGETLEPFDDDGLIPAFGFGDQSTKDRTVFPFRTEGHCQGFHDVLQAYNQITPTVRLSGPTSFAPLIHQAIEIVKATKQYHILVIVADGQVTSEGPTREAIVEASRWPLSIVMVGVGDGPWEIMQDYDDNLPTRQFDNFQFVDFNKVLTYGSRPEPAFALHALMEIPDQYKQIRKAGLLDF